MSIAEVELDAGEQPPGDSRPMQLAVTRCLRSPEECESVGRYGEALVVAHLLRVASPRVVVEWLNAAGESGASCDIVTKVRLASPAERWGGFGTCVQNMTTGETKPSATTDQGPTTRLQHHYRLKGPCLHAGPVH